MDLKSKFFLHKTSWDKYSLEPSGVSKTDAASKEIQDTISGRGFLGK